MRAIVVGRHTPSGEENIEIVGNKDDKGIPQPRPINFPASAEGCQPILWELLKETLEMGCKLIFQAVPTQLAVAIGQVIYDDVRFVGLIGGIVNTPGERPAGAEKTFLVDAPHDAGAIEEAVRFANPRATTELVQSGAAGGCKVTVDPPMKFKFSHIEWF